MSSIRERIDCMLGGMFHKFWAIVCGIVSIWLGIEGVSIMKSAGFLSGGALLSMGSLIFFSLGLYMFRKKRLSDIETDL